MNKKLEEIAATWDDIAQSVDLCDAYVKANPKEFVEFADFDVHQCVQAVDVFRATGMEESMWRVDVWIRHHFEPQQIGGAAAATVRIVG